MLTEKYSEYRAANILLSLYDAYILITYTYNFLQKSKRLFTHTISEFV